MSEIREALTAAGAQPFVPKIISPVLVEYQRRYAPWCRAISTDKTNSTTYYFNTRTVNVSGGAVPDGGARPVSTSTYTQTPATMGHVQAVGLGLHGGAEPCEPAADHDELVVWHALPLSSPRPRGPRSRR